MPSRILVIHTMKTGGSSLRRIIQSEIGVDAIYPSDQDLTELPHGWYPGPKSLLGSLEAGDTHTADVLIGHLPYVLADAMQPRPKVVTLLREPVARTVSMMEHRRRHTPSLRSASYRQLLDHEPFVMGQVKDYQTKIFAFDSIAECPDHVNVPLAIDDDRFERALARLEKVDVLGLTENIPTFLAELCNTTWLENLEPLRHNEGGYGQPDLPPDVLERILELTARDRVLYERARQLVTDRTPAPRRPTSFWSRLLSAMSSGLSDHNRS